MPGTLREIYLDPAFQHNDFRDDLSANGFALLKQALPREVALSYRDSILRWLEAFSHGFKADDSETWVAENLPVLSKGGVFSHSVGHERWLWHLRQEAQLIAPFETLWKTHELLVSFDGINVSLPGPIQGTKDTLPWMHMDQSPYKDGFLCAQGVVNLEENDTEDGGLIVLEGTHKVMSEFLRTQAHTIKQDDFNPDLGRDFFLFTQEQLEWFTDRGCVWRKPNLSPGDLVIWDSRTIHYVVPPKGTRPRVAAYVCYQPRALATPEDLATKQHIFKERVMTTHWPCNNFLTRPPVVLRDGIPDVLYRARPVEEPEETERLMQLAGILPYA